MSSLSQRLHLGVQQKQILTPGLVQMVTVLQLNRLELKDMIMNEIAENPVLEEAAEAGEELTPIEVQSLLERERQAEPAEQALIVDQPEAVQSFDGAVDGDFSADGAPEAAAAIPSAEEPVKTETDPFDEIDFGSFFDDYLDPGFKSPASESVEKPSFETFLSSPVTLSDYLQSQLSVLVLPDGVRDAANSIIGNLDECGYLTTPLEEIAVTEGLSPDDLQAGLEAVQSLDPTGVGARKLRECLLLQLESRNARDSVAWRIVHDHLKLLETRQFSQLAKVLGRPQEHIQIAVNAIRHLDPAPGLRYSSVGARQVQPDVHISKDGDDYIISLNDDDIPQLRLNGDYKRMLDRDQEPNKDVRNYVKERYASALQLIKNIEQRKQTIVRVCQAIIRRQTDFLEYGIDCLKPMMIKEVAEEIGVHPSTVSRAVANKYAHTPQGIFELRYFFSEAVQGPSGRETPLLIVKRRVKKMIEDEDAADPLTDDKITARLQAEGIQVTRRTVAKYREDMKIPATHQRRVRA
ncbi:MAG: RNA polymerase factor sigma-54 [Acidobacteriaceae bacterium]|nr:RNA polymerase factor sigma-54 [Acidobacteriaceae bacterium]MBV8570003.1 RNA polymerase factor sigma-54 [Acidobacteriaceae bacterium]